MTCRMGRLYSPRELAIVASLCVAALLLGAVASEASHADEADYASQIGIFYKCLSIRNPALRPGTPVTILGFNSKGSNFLFGDA
jgi:hypothetical protein